VQGRGGGDSDSDNSKCTLDERTPQFCDVSIAEYDVEALIERSDCRPDQEIRFLISYSSRGCDLSDADWAHVWTCDKSVFATRMHSWSTRISIVRRSRLPLKRVQLGNEH
jgi:hypothetical protein